MPGRRDKRCSVGRRGARDSRGNKSCTQLKDDVRMLYTRVQTLLQRRRKQQRQQDQQQQENLMEISAPYDFKPQPVLLPGISQDELSMLRDKAAASRIGVYEVSEPPVYWSRYSPPPSRPGIVPPFLDNSPSW